MKRWSDFAAEKPAMAEAGHALIRQYRVGLGSGYGPEGRGSSAGRARAMIKFDHLRIPVTDLARSRDWYDRTLGLTVEFEVSDRQTVALQDTDDFTIFLQEVRSPVVPNR